MKLHCINIYIVEQFCFILFFCVHFRVRHTYPHPTTGLGGRTGVGKTCVKHASRTIDMYTGQLNAINRGEKMVNMIYGGDDFKRMLMTDMTALQ